MGGSNDPRYNLSFIVQNSVEIKQPMIAISVQYRLSAWGFLGGKEALEGGATNLGYRDQRLALHWIQEKALGRRALVLNYLLIMVVPPVFFLVPEANLTRRE
jgi:hypothetical protein